jgi:hypothetical protein
MVMSKQFLRKYAWQFAIISIVFYAILVVAGFDPTSRSGKAKIKRFTQKINHIRLLIREPVFLLEWLVPRPLAFA